MLESRFRYILQVDINHSYSQVPVLLLWNQIETSGLFLKSEVIRGRFHEKTQTEPESRLSQGLKSETFVSAEFFWLKWISQRVDQLRPVSSYGLNFLILFHIFSGLIFSLKSYIS